MRNIDEADLWHRTSPIFFTKKQILEILVAIEMRHCGMSKCLFDFVESFLSKSQLNSVQITSDTLTKVKTKTSRWAFERRSSGRISWRGLSFYRFFRIDGSINRHISRFWIRSFDESRVTHACRHHILRRSLLARSPVFSVSENEWHSDEACTSWRYPSWSAC